jgi:hypothetical protein
MIKLAVLEVLLQSQITDHFAITSCLVGSLRSNLRLAHAYLQMFCVIFM